MNILAQIPLSDVRVVDRWSKAKNGTLLKVAMRDEKEPSQIIGMRCGLDVGSKEAEFVVMLSGPKAGELATSHHLLDAALDVSELLEIVAVNPGIVHLSQDEYKPGMLLQFNRASYICCKSSDGISGVVCVSPDDRGKILNSLPADAMIVAHSIELRAAIRPIPVIGAI
jgi:hypothetical protein